MTDLTEFLLVTTRRRPHRPEGQWGRIVSRLTAAGNRQAGLGVTECGRSPVGTERTTAAG
jgi:hypothetical protein